jgi:ribulose-bisphosphate carboxylase large chain
MSRITATYLIETPLPLEKAAEVLAGEQSSGTFVAVPGETAELKQRYHAKVERITPLSRVDSPSLPGSRGGKDFQQADIQVSWPIENMGTNLPVLVSTLQGNLYELSQFSGLKLLDFDLPDELTTQFKGPRFGVAGTRRLMGVADRPLIGTIIKPSIGLTPPQTAEMVKTLVEAGIDFVKDDELMGNPPHSPFQQRLEAVMRVVNEHADKTGKKVMVAFNISDELDVMLCNYDAVVAAGGTCAMLSLNSVGLTGVKKICDQGQLAIHGHRNGWGMLNRHPLLGMGFAAYQKLWRLAGVDQIHVNGINNKFWEPDDSVVASITACQKPFGEGEKVLPVISSGQWGGQAFETYRRTKTIDVLYLAGGGIMAHPQGPAAGVAALRDAWAGAVAGLSLPEACSKYPALAAADEKFGSKG